MINLFRSSGEERLFWTNKVNNTFWRVDISKLLVKSSKELPSWYKKITPLKEREFVNNSIGFNVKTCPSFLDIFKNSLLAKSPCDAIIEYDKYGYTTIFPDEETRNLLTITSHTWNMTADYVSFKASEYKQLGPDWDENFQNIKLTLPILLSTKKKRRKVIFMPSFYYDQKNPLVVAPGIMDLLPKTPLDLSINFFLDVSNLGGGTQRLFIKKGDPLCLLYFPEGIPKLEYADLRISLRDKFVASWISKSRDYEESEKEKKSKCPFHF